MGDDALKQCHRTMYDIQEAVKVLWSPDDSFERRRAVFTLATIAHRYVSELEEARLRERRIQDGYDFLGRIEGEPGRYGDEGMVATLRGSGFAVPPMTSGEDA